jgi:hypothetical protein
MLRHTPATSVSARPGSPSQSPQKNQPRQDAAGAYALLRRMSTGRWPIWRILGTAAPARDLIVGVEWLRGSSSRYAVATISPDGRALSWTPCSSSTEAIDLLEQVPAHGTQQVAA